MKEKKVVKSCKSKRLGLPKKSHVKVGVVETTNFWDDMKSFYSNLSSVGK